jgi:hypothetical protein
MKTYNNFNEMFNASVASTTLNVFNQVSGSADGMWFVNKEKYADTRAIVYYLYDAEYGEEATQTNNFTDGTGKYQVLTGFMTDPDIRNTYKNIIKNCIDGIDNYSLITEEYNNNVYKIFSTRPLTKYEAYDVADEIDKVVVQLP